MRPHRRRGVVDVHDVAVAIGVHRVEDRQLLHPHRRPPVLEVLRQPHPPELLEHPRPIGRDDAQRHGDAAAIREHRPVDRPSDRERLVAQRPIGSPDLDDLLLDLERFRLAVEHVAAVFQREPVDIGAGRPVGRLRPGDKLGEALAENGEADPHRAVRRHARCRQLHLEVRVLLAPRQMRVAQEHGVTRRRLGRRDRPAVRSVRFHVLAPGLGVDAVLAGQPVVMDDAQPMGVDVLNRQRQHALRGRAEQGRVLGGPRVQAGRKCANQPAELRRLLRGPQLCLLRDAVGAHPAIARDRAIAVELGTASARLGVETHEQLRVPFHLRVSVRVKKARVVGREDVRDAVLVPQDFGPLFRSSRPGGDDGQRNERDAQPERHARACPQALIEVSHGETIHRAACPAFESFVARELRTTATSQDSLTSFPRACDRR